MDFLGCAGERDHRTLEESRKAIWKRHFRESFEGQLEVCQEMKEGAKKYWVCLRNSTHSGDKEDAQRGAVGDEAGEWTRLSGEPRQRGQAVGSRGGVYTGSGMWVCFRIIAMVEKDQSEVPGEPWLVQGDPYPSLW